MSARVTALVRTKKAEAALQEAYSQVERKVQERTADLSESNTLLKAEIAGRKRTEEALQKALTEVEHLKNQLQAENTYLQQEIKIEHNYEEIISLSDAFNIIDHRVEQVAPTDAAVLILGETGTGKELVARAVHSTSNRRDRPLVKLNCAALPVNLIESDLFGHEKGAFTGAHTQKTGRFELADGGTLFLDEIGDLPLDLQAKLLRVLQEGEFERLGSLKTIKVDVRVIAATNRDLDSAVENGEFRKDLFYRLNVFPIVCPPLRDRREDIPVLAHHFLVKYGAKIRKKFQTIPDSLLEALQAYDWPGNVRELENVIERAIILTKGSTLELDEQFNRRVPPPATSEQPRTLQASERASILRALEESDGVIEGRRGAAARLDLPPSSLRSRMRKLGIRKPPPS